MMGFHLAANKMVVIVMVAAACASVSSSLIADSDNKRLLDRTGVYNESSQEFHGKTQIYSSKSSTEKGNTSATIRHEKKMIHRLIGGHVKLYPKVTEAKDERETPPATWDDGLMMLAAGNGKEKTPSTNKRRDDDEEEKKTLSQQVKEGKYGLIQNEIYPTPPKRPGVISYLGNPEVPKDTAKNYGGLDEEEIWLAENHLLVLRGGKFPDHGTKPGKNEEKWPPIDDYKAPARQVKIPPRPEVPPPFPVQLTEGGPVQIIRANGSVSNVNDTADYDEYANYPEGFFPGEAPFYPVSSNATDLGDAGNSSNANRSYLPAFSGSEGTVGPFYPELPPGAVFLPPPNNQSDYEDEDQSIYYPPPYSFYYKQDNASSGVPPGPLVPGIILPPPPDFFTSLDEEKTTASRNRQDKIRGTSTTTTESVEETTTYSPPPSPRRKTVSKPYKVRLSTTTPSPTTVYDAGIKPTTRRRQQTVKFTGRTKSTRDFTTLPPVTRFVSPFTTPIYVETTTSRPEKPTTISSSDYYNVKTEIENHLVDFGAPQGGQWTGIVSSTSVPLLAYYATTSSSSDRTRSADETTGIHAKGNSQSKNQASYYFYEETNDQPTRTTTPLPPIYFKTSTESPRYYNVEAIGTQRQPKKQYYSVEMIPSQQTANDYDIKLSSLIKTRGQNYNGYNSDAEALRNTANNKYNVERIRTQSQQRNLGENSARYYQPVALSAPATIKQPYYTTQKPRFYYRTSQNQQYDYRDEGELKSNPVYQYSYEATDYVKKRNRQSYREQEIQEPAVYPDYSQQPPSTNSQYYNDYDTQPVEKVEKSQGIRYLVTQRPQPYAAVTAGTIDNTTPNPHHAYYTKQDEQLLDDVTKQYFTIFGKKLPETVLQSTTPLYRVIGTTTESPANHNVNTYVSNEYNNPVQRFKPPKVKVHYGDQTQRPYSLEGDTLVNYKNPLPAINPDAEFIPVENKPIIAGSPQLQGYRGEEISSLVNRPGGNYARGSNPRETYRGRYSSPPISLANDIAVNYRDPRPPINPDAEFINPVVQGHGNHADRGGSYFAYQLPGNGGHFYFLTPQAISQRENLNAPYIYPKQNIPRLIRRRRGPRNG